MSWFEEWLKKQCKIIAVHYSAGRKFEILNFEGLVIGRGNTLREACENYDEESR